MTNQNRVKLKNKVYQDYKTLKKMAREDIKKEMTEKIHYRYFSSISENEILDIIKEL
jgi:hypothetical protein